MGRPAIETSFKPVSKCFMFMYLLSKIMKFYTYSYHKKAVQLMHSMPIPSTRTIQQDNCFAATQMYKERGKSIMKAKDEEISDFGQDQFYFAATEEFYCAIPSRILSQEYGTTIGWF